MPSNSGKGFTIAIKLIIANEVTCQRSHRNLSLDQNLFPTIQPFVFPATPSQDSILLHSICNGDQIELINVRLLITPLMYSAYTMVPFSRIYLRCITYMPSLCLIKLNCVKCITWPSTQCLISFMSLCILPDSCVFQTKLQPFCITCYSQNTFYTFLLPCFFSFCFLLLRCLLLSSSYLIRL